MALLLLTGWRGDDVAKDDAADDYDMDGYDEVHGNMMM